MIIGAVRNPRFETIVMFGSGGVEVEGLRNVEFSLAPLNEAEADVLIDGTWAGRRLAGFRNLPPADHAAAVVDLIAAWAGFGGQFPRPGRDRAKPGARAGGGRGSDCGGRARTTGRQGAG